MFESLLLLLKRPFLLYAGGLLFLLILPGFFAAPLGFWQPVDEFVWYHKSELAREGPPADDFLVLGDSQAMSSILPQEIQRLTGRNGYNYGMPGAIPEAMEFLLYNIVPDRRSAAGGEPGLVLIGVGPGTLLKTPNRRSSLDYFQTQLLPQNPLLPVQTGALHLYGRSVKELPTTIIRLFPAYRLNQALGGAFTLQQGVSSPGTRANKNQKVTLYMEKNRGFWSWGRFNEPDFSRCAAPRTKETRGEAQAKPIGVSDGARSSLPLLPELDYSPEAESSYRRIKTFLENRGIDYLVLVLPLPASWEKAFRASGMPLDVLTQVSSRIFDPDRLIPYDAYRKEAPDLAFQDHTHVTECSALIYSPWVATIVEKKNRGSKKSL